jgi:hypothetical protein
MKRNAEINMGSNIIDLYMEGYDEGKDDCCESVVAAPTTKKRMTKKERVATRRKTAYYKAKKRMAQLDSVAHYVPSEEDESVVMGMLRSHQLPISDPILTCHCSIGNKKRQDSAEDQLIEHLNA